MLLGLSMTSFITTVFEMTSAHFIDNPFLKANSFTLTQSLL